MCVLFLVSGFLDHIFIADSFLAKLVCSWSWESLSNKDRFGKSKCQNIKISHGIEIPCPTQTAGMIYCWHSLPGNSFTSLPLHQVLSDQRVAFRRQQSRLAWNRHKFWLWGMSCTGLGWAPSLWVTSRSVCCDLILVCSRDIWWESGCSPNLQASLLVSCTPLEFTETNSQVLTSAFSSFLFCLFARSRKHLVILCTISP